jgi:hypothetical protein
MKNFFKFYIKYIWPMHRWFIKKSERCIRCLNKVQVNKVLCEECKKYKNVGSYADCVQTKIKADAFDIEIKNCINKHHIYDFSFMLSGGKDSCYTLLKFVELYPDAKILCIFVNNGFYTDKVVDACVNLCKNLNVNLIIDNKHVFEFKEKIKNGLLKLKDKDYKYNPVDFIDGSFIFQIGEKISIENNVPNILCGMTPVQVKNILNIEDYLIDNDLSRVIFPMSAWDTTEYEISITLNEKLPSNDFNIISTNNSIIPILSALDVLKNGECSFEKEMSKNIRLGKAERKQYLYLFECLEWFTKKGFLNKEINKCLKQFNLSIEDVI